MSTVIIAIGSNTLPDHHLALARRRLASVLSGVRFSRELRSQDYHGRDVWYLNQLARGECALSADELETRLKAIEAESGRTADRVTLDLDLMQYDGRRYHERDWPRPYIQQLLPDIL